ncbi:MAG: Metal dependent phosphohydrolase [Candidatus Moranbacteria bacterium GW2011_GWC1_45_18]|nr:MAG: Metal dependent phosphohydrolase [Candidatus Moranbacteria bacterium GW2011_GWC2_40_12]KKT33767.1 MAG: Metal dependent phosphohydrolase [Candidatus Moranbacteria bacterium GW2011_GWF2_44_10]KKU00867.1 MAG: Metal dependent phosphohydrolase [Candidatus Moranbacteria bacterium GW2011_GWC1_45_18]OGI36973.1 MAG: hypothetical protein A2407_04980 [Candidatus Moranbacteria bacterium RIFOXYC1_FULL_44_8]OGI39188.1 MAG: hypothetical protein A2374_04585 [Candidatus Moranbacteria bacterium RIFOXYB1_
MNKLGKIKKFAEGYMARDKCSAHNMDHVNRVYNNALKISKDEKIDLEVVKIAILLHDIGGSKEMKSKSGKFDHAIESAKIAGPFLQKLGFSEEKIRHICDCIITHRYRTENKPKTKEAQIVFDSDKLDTIGAIGIARQFVWVGKNNAHIFRKMDIEKYAQENLGGSLKGRLRDKTKHSPQLSWETKGKHILKSLYTKKTKEIARKRMKFSENFLKKLEREIGGLE